MATIVISGTLAPISGLYKCTTCEETSAQLVKKTV